MAVLPSDCWMVSTVLCLTFHFFYSNILNSVFSYFSMWTSQRWPLAQSRSASSFPDSLPDCNLGSPQATALVAWLPPPFWYQEGAAISGGQRVHAPSTGHLKHILWWQSETLCLTVTEMWWRTEEEQKEEEKEEDKGQRGGRRKERRGRRRRRKGPPWSVHKSLPGPASLPQIFYTHYLRAFVLAIPCL